MAVIGPSRARWQPWTISLVVCLMLAFATGPGARAGEINGVDLPASLMVDRAELALASCGMREVMWTDVYAIAFYLPDGMQPESAMWDRAVAKTIRFDIVYDGEVPEDVPTEWRENLREVLSNDAYKMFRDAYADLNQGDVIAVSYTPDSRTKVTVNDELILDRPGHDLVEAMLEICIGSDPVSGNLKRLLLKDSC